MESKPEGCLDGAEIEGVRKTEDGLEAIWDAFLEGKEEGFFEGLLLITAEEGRSIIWDGYLYNNEEGTLESSGEEESRDSTRPRDWTGRGVGNWSYCSSMILEA